MATKYVEEFASTTDFIARAPDRSNKLGIGSVGERLYINRAGAAAEIIGDQFEVVTATKVLTAAENGKVCILNSATEFATTLPAVAAGLRFRFIVGAAPSGASYTVVAASGTPIHGMVISKDLNGATDSGATAGTGVLTLTFVDGKAQKGDVADFYCDGTNWFVVAITGGNFDAITLS